jgi:hypothetical protein
MSRTGEEDEVPPQFDDENNMNNDQEDDKLSASESPSLEDLMRRLEKLMTENNKLRRKAKGKKTKGGSSSNKDEDSSLEEDVSKKGKKGRNNHDKPSYNLMSFNYDNMPNTTTTTYTSIPVDKAPYFDETCYNQWKHCMKIYLYSISPEVWQVVCDGVEFSDEDEQLTADQLQKIHHNAQAISILTSSTDKEESNRVDGLDVAKDVWNTLWMAHE